MVLEGQSGSDGQEVRDLLHTTMHEWNLNPLPRLKHEHLRRSMFFLHCLPPKDREPRSRPHTWCTPRARVSSLRADPDWLIEPQRRAERALVAVVAQCYVEGVSTRRVDDVVTSMGITGISKSQVSELAKSLDETVAAFRNRPLDAGPYTYVWVDALTQKVREGGRIVNVAVIVAPGVNADGHREILAVDLITTEDGAGWTAFLRGLVARGLSGVAMVVSDAHQAWSTPSPRCCPGPPGRAVGSTSSCNVHTKVPKTAQSMVGALIRSIFEEPDAEQVHAQHARVVDQLHERFPDAASMLVEAEADILAFASFPKEHWRQIWSNNPQERLNKEIRRRTDVVGIFPNRTAVIRLVGAVLVEQHDEWAVARRYMGIESLAKARLRVMEGTNEEVALAQLADVS